MIIGPILKKIVIIMNSAFTIELSIKLYSFEHRFWSRFFISCSIRSTIHTIKWTWKFENQGKLLGASYYLRFHPSLVLVHGWGAASGHTQLVCSSIPIIIPISYTQVAPYIQDNTRNNEKVQLSKIIKLVHKGTPLEGFDSWPIKLNV